MLVPVFPTSLKHLNTAARVAVLLWCGGALAGVIDDYLFVLAAGYLVRRQGRPSHRGAGAQICLNQVGPPNPTPNSFYVSCQIQDLTSKKQYLERERQEKIYKYLLVTSSLSVVPNFLED